MRKSILLLSFVVAILAGACGGDQEVVTGSGGGGDSDGRTDPSPSRPDRPAGAENALVVSVEVGGGFLMPGDSFRRVPQAAVYDDGTALSPGATIAIYPAPALPDVTEGRLGPDEVNELLAAAERAGLLDETEKDFGNPSIADAGTTTITVVVDGSDHVTSVYALGGTGDDLPGITVEQQQAHQRVAEFVDLVSRSVAGAGGDRYLPERYRVLPLAPETEPDPAVAPDEREWSFPDLALQEGVGTPVPAERAAEFADALAPATQITRWRTDAGDTFVLAVGVVFPHEPDCPA
ncbi:hypothetical protein BH20ACT1_BH20ACT1_09410 [soil metagenome]